MTNEPARPPLEGAVLPAGHTRGVPSKYDSDDLAWDAAAALVAAGHTPALLSNKTDDDDVDSAHGTGFKVEAREGGRVLVYHLVGGVDSWVSLSDADRRVHLRAYRASLRAAGWECDSRLFRTVHAWRTL